MLEWSDYLRQLLSQECSFDGITLSFDQSNRSIGVPPIIKASVLMLDKMMKNQGQFNIIVFPERIQSIFIFTLVKLLYNISERRIESTYDPKEFKPGDHLRFGSAVIEFVGVIEEDKKMQIRTSDLVFTAPMDLFPLFQKTKAKKLSPYSKYITEKKKADAEAAYMTPDERHIKLMSDYRTHMDSSIMNMTPIINTKEMIRSCKLCGQDARDILLIGQADFEGNVRNIGTGQLEGIPAIVLAPDLYCIAEAAERGHPVQSVIIDGSNANALLTQLDALDRLLKLNVPITCVTDIVNSFDLQPFIDRGFNLWRWNERNITSDLYDIDGSVSDIKTKHCAIRTVNYLEADGREISAAIKLLSMHKSESQTLSASMLKVVDDFYSLTFLALHEIVPFQDAQLELARNKLDRCKSILENEKKYLDSQLYTDYLTVLKSLQDVYKKAYALPKIKALASYLDNESVRKLCIVVAERTEKEHVREYWQRWCSIRRKKTEVTVLYPSEYYQTACIRYSLTVVVGWLKRAIMRKVLYSYNTRQYVVLLYDYEKRWKKYDTYRWNRELDSTCNQDTIRQSFENDKIRISVSRFEDSTADPIQVPQTDEFAEIEMTVRENKFRQYVASGGQKAADQIVEAVPVNFVGGYLSFYQTGHKVLSASDIILNDADRIKMPLPNELHLGDFVVVRETDRDLIKEMADIILRNSGLSDLRYKATMWKEALLIGSVFNDDNALYNKLQKAGCKKGKQTVMSWLHDGDIIAPMDYNDLKYIAKATNSAALTEMLDDVYDAAQTVRKAHVQAGKNLSAKLRNKIVDSLKEYGDIDPFNIWEPIEIQIEDIGLVRILKIIDIGSPILVDQSNTNRLIEEE